jgi:hypothetical protein
MRQTTTCPRSGTKIAKSRLKGAIFVQGQQWLAQCPTCNQRPGSAYDRQQGVVYVDHER